MAAQSVMDDCVVFSTAIELDIRSNRGKKCKWTQDDPIPEHLMAKIDGFWLWSPTAFDDPGWIQYEEDVPTTAMALFKLKSSQGDFEVSQTYPHKYLLEDLKEHIKKAYAENNDEEGRCAAFSRIAAMLNCFVMQATNALCGELAGHRSIA